MALLTAVQLTVAPVLLIPLVVTPDGTPHVVVANVVKLAVDE